MAFSIRILLFQSYPEKLGELIRLVVEDPGVKHFTSRELICK